ncbi:FAD-dependent oxidoreductase [Anthocerotibacter panamensis]|uniref:FAD-dependent oxidoreductase n=1 Tax=Anthocerotibacter panamensis TaxID=2857077 RepID=UPI001C407CFF|nr:FAD-dependent oxidoreductase [Anthocerotibacter panamensis]
MSQELYAVVGGGASGIAAAYFLRQQGIAAEVIEQDESLGGRTGTLQLGERSVAMGGKNIGRQYTLFRQFTQAMGDNPYEFFGLNSSQVRDGKLITIDGSRRVRSSLNFFKNCTSQDIFQFLQMCAQVKFNDRNGYLGGSYFSKLGEDRDEQPLSAHFSKEFCNRIVRPMSVRMNGAEPDEIYLGNFGSNLRMVLDNYDQLTRGLSPVLAQFARSGAVRLGTKVEGLLVQSGRVNGLRVLDHEGRHDLNYAGVILATPAPVSARLVEPHDQTLAQILAQVNYYPVAVLVAEYKRPIFSEQVRALVFDDREPISNANAYGVHDRHIIRYTFSGRTARRYLEIGADPERLLCIGEQALNRHIPVSSQERVRFVARQYTTGLCAYTPYFTRFAAQLEERVNRLPGLYITGDYLRGASVEACFRAGQVCARQVARFQSQQVPPSGAVRIATT